MTIFGLNIKMLSLTQTLTQNESRVNAHKEKTVDHKTFFFIFNKIEKKELKFTTCLYKFS